MIGTFKENRKYIEHEFENAEWNLETGMMPSDIERNLQKMYDENCESIPMLRAKMYGYIFDNAQIAINPKTPFSAKFNIGVNFDETATQDFIQTNIYKYQL